MAEDEVMGGLGETVVVRRRGHRARSIILWAGRLVVVLLALLAAAVLYLNTGSGRQFIVNQIAKVAPASGLKVSVGRIEGSVLWNATLYDVKFRDAGGRLFLTVPAVELNWRPYKFPFSGLDVRALVLHHGTLYAKPKLVPGNPNAPTLPNFDIRVDRFVIDDLTVNKGLLGEERHVNFQAHAHVHRGLVKLDANGQLGGGDRFKVLINAEPDGNVFDLDLDYRAPKGGLLASLAGTRHDTRVRLLGNGTWKKWDGALVANEDGAQLAALKLVNRSGLYRISGLVQHRDYLTGLAARALGDSTAIAVVGTLKSSVLAGSAALRGHGVSVDGTGGVDLGNNAFRKAQLRIKVLDSQLFGPGLTMRDASVRTTLDGPWRGFSAPFDLSVGQADFGGTVFNGIAERGRLAYDGARWTLPLDASIQRIVSGNTILDPKLANGRLTGTVYLANADLRSDDLQLRFPGLTANLTLRGDINRGGYGIAGPVEARGLVVPNLGTIDAGAKFRFLIGNGVPWRLAANFTGRMPRVSNATLANLSGGNIRFQGGVQLASGQRIVFHKTTIRANKLSLLLDGRIENGTTTLVGTGRHVDYGAFTVKATLAKDGPHADLVFANPMPAAGLRDVHIALVPTRDGFQIDTNGESTLGPFKGLLFLTSPAGGPTRLAIDHLDVWRTAVTGNLTLGGGAASGNLRLSGGGLNGTIALAPHGAEQGFDIHIPANDATFGGATHLAIRQATIVASGFVGGGHSSIQGNVQAQGISYGSLFIGRAAAQANIVNGRGAFNGSLSGRRGSQFDLQVSGDITPDRIAAAARGHYGGQTITMPRRAVLLKQPDGSWQLQKTQIAFGGGIAIAEGQFGGAHGTQMSLSLAKLPLSLIDIGGGDLGLGGSISGIVDFHTGQGGAPSGDARVVITGLTRSGLLLTSRPVDLALVAQLTPTLLQARAVLQDKGQMLGRLQGRIANLPPNGALFDRLSAGDLYAQLRYQGPADALWRLAAVETFDVTGTVNVAADVRGSLANPQVRGSVAGDNLRVQSVLTGTDLKQVKAAGSFAGSRLQLTSFAGTAPNGGSVVGSGFVDFSGLGPGRGPALDLRIAANKAQILDLTTMGATVTGPMRIVSNGVGGTIAGRLKVNKAHWRLGAATGAAELPNIKTTDINLPADLAPPAPPGAPWRYLIDATAPGGIKVDGMGLDSEWSANIVLRGTTADPRIGGIARVVPRQGFYDFAGARFDITRGVIDFNENSPPDPQIDLLAETTVNSLTVKVTVGGSASKPDIEFLSTPSMPEEEILAQLLFGGSISNLSATDALQLGAAVASLRGGAGLDPINRLRKAIGLDRLRIVPADPALNHGTALALGKRFGRRFYVELITDGRGYNATSLEFRITSWLSLLGSVSSLGRETIAAAYHKDY
ncbi:MAG: translocation/assembly module TamB domain-containing protein [Croceibacterium sp.]